MSRFVHRVRVMLKPVVRFPRRTFGKLIKVGVLSGFNGKSGLVM